MKMKLQRCVGILGGLCVAGTCAGQWSTDPANTLRIADLGNEQVQPKIQPTPDGGCFVSWFDNAAGGYDVYLQRLSAAGVEQWPHNGVLVCDRSVSSTVDYDLIADSSGNAVLAYNDDLVSPGTQQVSVSRVSAAGTVLWKTTVSSSAQGKGNPRLVQLSDGSFVVGYSLGTSPQSWVAQRLDSGGSPLWAAPGITIAEATNYLALTDLEPAGTGFIAMWVRASGTNPITTSKGLRLQKYDAAGAAEWNAGVATSIFAGNASQSIQNGYFPTMQADGSGGAVIAWYETSGSRNAYLQHVLSTGALKFPTPISNAVTPATRIRLGAALAYDAAADEYYVASPEGGTTTVVDRTFVQKFDSAGALLWGNTGVEIIPTGSTQQSFVQCILQSDGCIVAGLDTRSATTRVVFAAKAKNDQTVPWSILVNNDSSTDKGRLAATRSSQGFALFAFQWGGTGSADIAAQNVNSDGSLGTAACYANCDGSAGAVLLTANDFQCFLNRFANSESYADCDGVGGLTPNDFQCFLNSYAAGCS
jgi:hypothetical protein